VKEQTMTEMTYVPLPGSERTALPQAGSAGSLDETEHIQVTLVTRRKAALPRTAAGSLARISRDDLRQKYGSEPADQALVAQVLASADPAVTVVQQDPASRLMTISGPAGALAGAFRTQLRLVTSTRPDGSVTWHRYREGGLQVPAALDGIVVAVLGLDNRPQAQTRLRRPAAVSVIPAAPPAPAQPTVPAQPTAPTGPTAPAAPAVPAPVSYTPPQVAAAYQFPPGTDGTGQHVAILEFGGGYADADLDAYFASLGITPPSITAVSVGGAQNVPGKDPSGADGEVLLDIEVVGSVAPGAAMSVYFAPNSDQGFVQAVTAAAHATPAPVAISISWGQSEDAWTAQARTALDNAIADAAATGITVTVASGDNGSSDGVSGTAPHCDFPASSPHALGCGGTSLRYDSATGALDSEQVWNDGAGQGACGGGVSDVFALPSWQSGAGVPAVIGTGKQGRGVPDVAGNADPQTGYQVRIDGQTEVIGGTSAVAPLWAALICRLAQAAGHSFGLIQEALYAGVQPAQPAPGLRDITTGNNGAYQAGPGWDSCTGLGVPQGTALLSRLTAAGASAPASAPGSAGAAGPAGAPGPAAPAG
jgi:kumamolisin